MITQGKWYVTTELSGMTQIRGGNTGTTKDHSICAIGMDNVLTEEQRANAALIAAAPRLLSALRALCDAERQVEQHGVKDAGGYLDTEIENAENLIKTLDG